MTRRSAGFLGVAGVLFALALAWTGAESDARGGPIQKTVTRYGVYIKERSAGDPWKLIARYDSRADAQARVVLMMRHGGQYAVQIFEIHEVIPSLAGRGENFKSRLPFKLRLNSTTLKTTTVGNSNSKVGTWPLVLPHARTKYSHRPGLFLPRPKTTDTAGDTKTATDGSPKFGFNDVVDVLTKLRQAGSDLAGSSDAAGGGSDDNSAAPAGNDDDAAAPSDDGSEMPAAPAEEGDSPADDASETQAAATPPDIELLDVRFVAKGDGQTGPLYRVSIRNNGKADVTRSFSVALLASTTRDVKPESPKTVATVKGIKAGAVKEMDVRLPAAVMNMGRNADGESVPFTWLFVVADCYNDLKDATPDNNMLVLNRRDILVIEAK
jgi:hypothetical protein